MKNANDYAEKVVRDFITDITDNVFLAIERNETAMREYMSSVGSFGLEAVNTTIGKKVKEILNLENDGENGKPQSRLIKSYTRHKVN